MSIINAQGNGQMAVIKIGSISAAANEQIKQAVTASANSATAAATSATSAAADAATAEAAAAQAQAVGPVIGQVSNVGIVAVGDSITAILQSEKMDWLRKLCFFSNQKYRFRGIFCTPGLTAEEIETNWLPSVLGMNPLPRACVIEAGANNYGTDTIVETGIQAVMRMCDALVAKGIMPVLWMLSPRGDIPTSEAYLTAWNYQIQMLREKYGYPLIDAAAALADPSAYQISPSTYTVDGTHPTALGCCAIAQYALSDPKFTGSAPADGVPWLETWNADPTNCFPNALFLTDSNNDGLADGLTAATGLTPTLVADTAIKGQWQELACASGVNSTSGVLTEDLMTAYGFAVGDVIDFAFRLKTTSTVDSVAGPWSAMIQIYYADANWAPVTTEYLIASTAMASEDGIIYEQITIPADAVHMQIQLGNSNFAAPNDISLQIAQFTVRNVTSPALFPPATST